MILLLNLITSRPTNMTCLLFIVILHTYLQCLSQINVFISSGLNAIGRILIFTIIMFVTYKKLQTLLFVTFSLLFTSILYHPQCHSIWSQTTLKRQCPETTLLLLGIRNNTHIDNHEQLLNIYR